MKKKKNAKVEMEEGAKEDESEEEEEEKVEGRIRGSVPEPRTSLNLKSS